MDGAVDYTSADYIGREGVSMNGNAPESEQGRSVRLDPCWPVLPGPRYRGVVWNHLTLKDGTLITTSAVVELAGGRIVTRSGSIYELGCTFDSEQHAAEQAGGRRNVNHSRLPHGLRVLDLESDDLSALGTFAHERLSDSER